MGGAKKLTKLSLRTKGVPCGTKALACSAQKDGTSMLIVSALQSVTSVPHGIAIQVPVKAATTDISLKRVHVLPTMTLVSCQILIPCVRPGREAPALSVLIEAGLTLMEFALLSVLSATPLISLLDFA